MLACSYDPVTGYFRDGCCNTDSTDRGNHTICTRVTGEFLDFSREQGNDLSTPMPEYRFAGLKPGDRWCVCADPLAGGAGGRCRAAGRARSDARARAAGGAAGDPDGVRLGAGRLRTAAGAVGPLSAARSGAWLRPAALKRPPSDASRDQREPGQVGVKPGLDQQQRRHRGNSARCHSLRAGRRSSRAGSPPGRPPRPTAVANASGDRRPVADHQQRRLVDEHERHDVGRRCRAHRRQARSPTGPIWRGRPRRRPRAPPAA